MGITKLLRNHFVKRSQRTDLWATDTTRIQLRELRRLLTAAKDTDYGKTLGFTDVLRTDDASLYKAFAAQVPRVGYEDIRTYAERMLRGEKDVLWPVAPMPWLIICASAPRADFLRGER